MRSNDRHALTRSNVPHALIFGIACLMISAAVTATSRQDQAAEAKAQTEQIPADSGHPPRASERPFKKQHTLAKGCAMVFEHSPGITHQLAYHALKQSAKIHSDTMTASGHGCSAVFP